MATDEEINDAIQAYLTERAYGGLETDGLAIAAAAGWEMLRAEVARLRAIETAARAWWEAYDAFNEAVRPTRAERERLWEDVLDGQYQTGLALVALDAARALVAGMEGDGIPA